MSAVRDAFNEWWPKRTHDVLRGLPRFEFESAFSAGWEAALVYLEERESETPRFRTLSGEPRVIPSRTGDPGTSHAAAKAITVKAGTQRAHLLKSFAAGSRSDLGWTDEEAMCGTYGAVRPESEYSKRCSELREAGFIEETGTTRIAVSGHQRIVSRITDKGREAVKGL